MTPKEARMILKYQDHFPTKSEWLRVKEAQQTLATTQWKPTDEQINALDEVYKTHGANSACRRIIFELLKELKQL